jgi:adenylate cyclase
MLGKLVPCGGGPIIPLLKPKLLVGRQPFCDIPLSFPTVSSRHCELELLEGYWHVRDLGSSNGTRVNNAPCTSGRLMPNDVLSVSKHRYTVVYDPPPDRLPPRAAAPPAAPAAARPGRWESGTALGELVPCGGGETIPLRKPKLLLGRQAGCDIVLPFGYVSARHCELEFAEGRWTVRDLGSRNGIRVDGERCQEKGLDPGSVLAICSLRYRVVYAAPGPASPQGEQRRAFAQGLLEAAGLVRWKPPEDQEGGPKRQTLEEPE